jgi:hypothetical protein
MLHLCNSAGGFQLVCPWTCSSPFGQLGIVEPSDEQPIERLEVAIEAAAHTIEWCRKFIIISKVTMTLGGLWLVAIATGVERFTPVAMIFAITMVIAGIVGFGTNRSTAEQAGERLEEAERLRAQLIDRLRLEEVGGP